MSTCFFFFFNDTATTEIYTLSLHDALPICAGRRAAALAGGGSPPLPDSRSVPGRAGNHLDRAHLDLRSEEHTSELQSQSNLVCRLLLEKKKKYYYLAFIYRTASTYLSYLRQ